MGSFLGVIAIIQPYIYHKCVFTLREDVLFVD